MENITLTKNQHYVPQFLLKNFSKNKKQIGIYQKNKGVLSKEASIKNQCSENWFYGKMGTEEKLATVEREASKVINKLLREKQIDYKEKELLYKFVYLQSNRTRKKINSTNLILRQFQQKYIEKLFEVNNLILSKDLLENFLRDNGMTPEKLVKKAEEKYKEIMDLDYIILKATEDTKRFIIGDSPVVNYNYYLRRFESGLKCCGLMLIMPLSLNTTLVLYDSKIYQFSCINKKKIINISSQETKKLNNLQFINCERNIFFNENLSEEEIRELEQIKIIKKENIIGNKISREDKEFIDLYFNFFSITDEGFQLQQYFQLFKNTNFEKIECKYLPRTILEKNIKNFKL